MSYKRPNKIKKLANPRQWMLSHGWLHMESLYFKKIALKKLSSEWTVASSGWGRSREGDGLALFALVHGMWTEPHTGTLGGLQTAWKGPNSTSNPLCKDQGTVICIRWRLEEEQENKPNNNYLADCFNFRVRQFCCSSSSLQRIQITVPWSLLKGLDVELGPFRAVCIPPSVPVCGSVHIL
jgi:hypothetical protein